MSNNLIKRLLNAPADGTGTEDLCAEAADRIEELEHEKKEAWLNELDALAKLAKAVEAAKAYRIATKHLKPCPETSAGLDAVLDELEVKE
jgi:hypothetical protein